MSLPEVFIVSGARTPIGSLSGAFANVKASDLGSVVIKEVLKRANVAPTEVSEVIVGQTLTAGQGQNTARQASLKAGLPNEVPAYTINMLCGSGLKSVVLGYQAIRCGDSKVVVCGGQENMSLAPHVINLRSGVRMGDATMVDSLLHDGLTDAMHSIHMGVTAENLAKEYNISKEEQDLLAVHSQNITENAQKNGYFDKELVPVEVTIKRQKVLIKEDEYPKHGTSIANLQNLKSCFIKEGTVTAGNASGINDSASAVLLMSSEEAAKKSVKPMARIVAWAQAGVDPKVMGIGPVEAVKQVLTKAGWDKDQVDLFELNEAFAAQALSVNKCLGIDASKVNINGGAIALGHPIGASGNRILVTLLYALERTNKKKGIAALCVGGGMGIALAVERL